MARWEPNAQERLQEAAMELFREHGYDRTTAAAIAERAGLTERTFFRYFTDKREVLFSRSKELEKLVVDAIAAAPSCDGPLDVAVNALATTGTLFDARRPYARKRQALLVAHPELMERELIKLASLGAAVATSLVARGLAEPSARLVAETSVTLFKNAFERWLRDPDKHGLAHHMHATLAELRVISL